MLSGKLLIKITNNGGMSTLPQGTAQVTFYQVLNTLSILTLCYLLCE